MILLTTALRLVLGVLPAAEPSSPLSCDTCGRDAPAESPTAKAENAAQAFVEALAAGNEGELAELGTDPFTFDGRKIQGRDRIRDFWKQLLQRSGKALADVSGARYEVLGFEPAVARFGQPPRKFSHLDLKSCLFVAVTFRNRSGFLLVLQQSRKDGPRVTAVTD